MTLASEKATDHRLEDIYADIKATLRVSIVPLPFLLWSQKNSQLLELIWSRLRTNLETRYVECAADKIRKQAVGMLSFHRPGHRIEADDISLFTIQKCRVVIDIHHYINPKLLLIVTALAETLRRHPFNPIDDPRWSMRIPRGISPDMPAITLSDDSRLSVEKKILLKKIRKALQLPQNSTEYLGLACYNGYLEKAWLQLKPFTQTPAYRTFSENLQLLTMTLVHGLPFPLEMRRDDFAQAGMAGLEVLNWVIPFQNALPGLIFNMAALKIGLDGSERASQSPYPV